MARTWSRFPARLHSVVEHMTGLEPASKPPQAGTAPLQHQRAAGHRQRPHTADLIIEAFGQTRNECIEQAVLALVESFIDLRDVLATGTSNADLPRADDVESLISVLEEAIYFVDARGLVPTAASVRDQPDGLHVVFEVVPLARVRSIGPAPKGIARHAIFIAEDGGEWACRVVVDV